jgi:hypothetical protein
MLYLVTVNRNVKYSTQIESEDDAKEQALEQAQNAWRFPDDFDVNEDSGYFASYAEKSNDA